MVIGTRQKRVPVMPADLRRGFRLGPFVIEPLRGAVSGPEGESHHLEPKVMDVFVLLATNANETVTREHLLGEVWTGQVAADELLTRAVSELRRVLDSGNENLSFIETIPKRGYRLIGDVHLSSRLQKTYNVDGMQGEAAKRGLIGFVGVIGALVALVVILTISIQKQKFEQINEMSAVSTSTQIAIYPLENLSLGAAHPNLGRTISEGILHRLVATDDVQVLSIGHIVALMNKKIDALEIANQLNATHLLNGSYQVSGEEIRWTARLTDKANGQVVWADEDFESLENILSMQRRIAERVAESIGVLFDSNSIEPSRKVKAKAYSVYSDAQESIRRFELAEARSLLTSAVKIDPEFAEALAALGQVLVTQGWLDGDPHGPLVAAGEVHARKALEIDPSNSAAYSAIALAKSNQHDWIESKRNLRLAIDRSNNSAPDPYLIQVLGNLGHGAQAIEMTERMARENPYSQGYTFLTSYYVGAGNYDRALRAGELAADYGLAVDGFRLGVVHAKRGDIEKATELFRSRAKHYGYDSNLVPMMVSALASGQFSQPLDDALRAEAERNATFEANLIYWFTFLQYPADKVFALADRLAESNRLNHIAFFGAHTTKYTEDPRFLELMEKIGLAEYWRTEELPDFCDLLDGELVCR